MVKVDRINISNEGLTKFFSPIEAQIMEVLWENNEMMTAEITKMTGIPLSSVAGTLDRLVKADFAQRRVENQGKRVRYVYSATTTADNAANAITTRILDSLVDTFGAVAIENFSKYKNDK
ncbi:MAG: putative transcriptional regulator [Candidatus Methanocomedens sp.]|nr:MAG: putative transcriptional regulator [ANME-2 cluster archaeon]